MKFAPFEIAAKQNKKTPKLLKMQEPKVEAQNQVVT